LTPVSGTYPLHPDFIIRLSSFYFISCFQQ
jgi:hypothetical protein